jgi:hypothetical protein
VNNGTQAGTYTVNCDGTGVVTRRLTVGTTGTEQDDDFVINEAIVRDEHKVATSIVDAQRTPSAIVAGGIFFNSCLHSPAGGTPRVSRIT